MLPVWTPSSAFANFGAGLEAGKAGRRRVTQGTRPPGKQRAYSAKGSCVAPAATSQR